MDDLALHARVQAGDPSALEELYGRYAPSAFGLALRVTGDATLAQDVVQDAFLALWDRPRAFDPDRGPLRTWLLALVHHRAVDAVRREARLRERATRAANLEPPAVEDPADEVVEDADLAERRRRVREALAGLPADQRRVIEMAYFDGKTQPEIASELKIPLGTVKTRTFAAMRRLRAAMEGPARAEVASDGRADGRTDGWEDA